MTTVIRNKYRTYDVTEPANGCEVFKDRYWFCVNGDPAKALMFGYSPQCNKSESILEHRLKKLPHTLPLKTYPNIQIVFIPNAFVPINPSDY